MGATRHAGFRLLGGQVQQRPAPSVGEAPAKVIDLHAWLARSRGIPEIASQPATGPLGVVRDLAAYDPRPADVVAQDYPSDDAEFCQQAPQAWRL